jgi:SAM-dependent methyltransferase
MDQKQLEQQLNELKERYGAWSYDIPLPHGVWTRGNLGLPHTRLRRIVQTVQDLVQKPLSECRVLDLGCLDGMFSIEFALHGASVLGIEIREANIAKAEFCKDALDLDRLEFVQDDVRNISEEKYGRFDAIICSGIHYHLPGKDAIQLVNTMQKMAERVVVIDTHIALAALQSIDFDGRTYSGVLFKEHESDASDQDKEHSLWASADNLTSFWFTRPSLTNIMSNAGFSSVYECFVPAHINFGREGIEAADRVTFVGTQAPVAEIRTSPAVNGLAEQWPEGSLGYGRGQGRESASLLRRIALKLMPGKVAPK